MNDAVVAAEGLVKRYGHVTAVDDVTLSVAKGEFLSLLGPSGCGKTTLLRLIAGFIDPDAGHLHIAGRNALGLAPALRNVGLVFQDYSLWPHMTVADNVGFGLDSRGIRGAERSRRVDECLELVQLDRLGGRMPRELSGGQQQRVALARALAYRPDVLLLDEPLSALDRKLREDLQAELRRLQHELGVTTILVTHDQEEALLLSDRVAVMSHGRIAQLGSPTEVYTRPSTLFVAGFVGQANLLPGAVEAVPGGVSFVMASGVRVPLDEENGPSGPATGLLRPEHLRIVAPDEPGAIEARLVDRSFLGPVERLSVKAADGTMLVVATPYGGLTGARPAPGASVGVTFDPRDLVVFRK